MTKNFLQKTASNTFSTLYKRTISDAVFWENLELSWTFILNIFFFVVLVEIRLKIPPFFDQIWKKLGCICNEFFFLRISSIPKHFWRFASEKKGGGISSVTPWYKKICFCEKTKEANSRGRTIKLIFY